MENVDKKVLSQSEESPEQVHTSQMLMLDIYDIFSPYLKYEQLQGYEVFPIHLHYQCTQEVQKKLLHDSVLQDYKFHQVESAEEYE